MASMKLYEEVVLENKALKKEIAFLSRKFKKAWRNVNWELREDYKLMIVFDKVLKILTSNDVRALDVTGQFILDHINILIEKEGKRTWDKPDEYNIYPSRHKFLGGAWSIGADEVKFR